MLILSLLSKSLPIKGREATGRPRKWRGGLHATQQQGQQGERRVQEILKEFHGLAADRVRGRERHVPAVPISYNYSVGGSAEKNVDAMSEGEARALLKRLLSSGLASGGEGSGGQGSGGSTSGDRGGGGGAGSSGSGLGGFGDDNCHLRDRDGLNDGSRYAWLGR